jgi:glucose-6-phosphate 1-dehydrogenase
VSGQSKDKAPSHVFVLFGGTGDLARRKLLPAVFRLSEAGLLAGRWAVLAVARNEEFDDESYRSWATEALREAGIADDAIAKWCTSCLHYVSSRGERPYERLRERIEELEELHGLPSNRLFYLALPPQVFTDVLDGLGSCGLNRSEGFTRVVVEKPIGHDLESARALEAKLYEWFDEEQIFRIDHYLGKDTVQNLLVLRFGNAIFEALWNRHHVRDVQITVAEDIGVEGRAGYYDRSGALRDMVQNHLTQLATLIAMEVPVAYDADAVRSEKIKVLRSIRPLAADDVVRGQYTASDAGPGYLDDPGVPDDSRTETFVAARLHIDNWRWQGVPFYLRTGKRLPRKTTEVAIDFHRPPVHLFDSLRCADVTHESLVIRLQPDEGFDLHLDVKRPGEPMRLQRVPLHFGYAEQFEPIHDAYVTLLLDAVQGDQTLFVHHDEVEASWGLYTPMLADQLESEVTVHPYAAGTWGPDAADALLVKAGHSWTTR